MIYTEITIKDQIATLHNVIRETEMKHFLAVNQATMNRTMAARFKDTDKRRFTGMRDQANKDDAEAESMALTLEFIRAKLDKLIESDPDNAATEEGTDDADEPTKLSLVKDEAAS